MIPEAQYAYHEKKPILFLRAQRGYVPDGWLGFMMGTRLYIDISGKYPFEDKFIELCKRIDVYKKQSIDQLNNHCQNKPIEVVCFISCLLFVTISHSVTWNEYIMLRKISFIDYNCLKLISIDVRLETKGHFISVSSLYGTTKSVFYNSTTFIIIDFSFHRLAKAITVLRWISKSVSWST